MFQAQCLCGRDGLRIGRDQFVALHRHQEIPLRDPARQLMPAPGPRLPSGPAAGGRSLSSRGMQRRSHRAHPRVAGSARGAARAAGDRLRLPGGRRGHPGAAPHAGAAALAQAPPGGPRRPLLDPGADAQRPPARPRRRRRGKPRLRVGAPDREPTAGASFLAVPTPDVPPFSFNGRIFIRRGGLTGYCSGTAINSPTRQLVLTAGHCLNSGREDGKSSVWSDYLAVRPRLQRRRRPVRRLRRPPQRDPRAAAVDQARQPRLRPRRLPHPAQLRRGQRRRRGRRRRHDRHRPQPPPELPDLRLSRREQVHAEMQLALHRRRPALQPLSRPADAGHPLPLGARRQRRRLAGPMVGDDTAINGINTYLHLDNKSHTFGPYFSARNRRQAGQGLLTEPSGVEQAAVEAVVAAVRAQVGGQAPGGGGRGLFSPVMLRARPRQKWA